MKNPQSKSILSLILITSLFLIANIANAGSGRVKARGAKSNVNGGTSTGQVTAAKGQNGGGFVRARGTTTNGQGQAAGGSTAAVNGPNAGAGIRASAFTADDSGNVNYQGASAATGVYGSAATTGGFNRTQEGGIKGSRSTAATSAATGNTYNGNTTYDSSTGNVNHTQKCYNSSGVEIKCPKRN